MKILVDTETKGILGAAILGVGRDEAIHSILDIMYAKCPIQSFNVRCTFTHLFGSWSDHAWGTETLAGNPIIHKGGIAWLHINTKILTV